jgi:biotin operon repressor
VGQSFTNKEKNRRLKVVDHETNEEVPALTWVRHKWKGESFFIGFQEAFISIAKKKKPIGAEAKNVFLFLLGWIDYHNIVTISQVEIARELGMKRQNVSRAISALVEDGVLQVVDLNRKRRRRLKLSNEYAWKGKLKSLPAGRK